MKDLGVLVPIVTPCSPAGEIDIEDVQAVCDEMLEAGNSSIFVMGSTGRGPWFSREDRVKMCRIVADHIGNDIPLFGGCMANGITDMVDNARAYADAGAQYVVITAPGYFIYSPKEIEAILTQFCDNSPLPVLLYDIPAFAKSKLDIHSIIRLCNHENVIGIKDSSADKNRFHELLNALANMKDTYLLQGKEHLLTDSILSGASGIVSTFSHFAPKPFVVLFNAAKDNRIELAEKLQAEILKLYDLVVACYEKSPEFSTLMHMVNLSMKKRGVCKNIMLAHEGECPEWLLPETEKAIEICNSANKIADEFAY